VASADGFSEAEYGKQKPCEVGIRISPYHQSHNPRIQESRTRLNPSENIHFKLQIGHRTLKFAHPLPENVPYFVILISTATKNLLLGTPAEQWADNMRFFVTHIARDSERHALLIFHDS
jgi:hypothetical protein